MEATGVIRRERKLLAEVHVAKIKDSTKDIIHTKTKYHFPAFLDILKR